MIVMSLRFYLRSRLLLLGLTVALPAMFLVFHLYELGLDDATEGYLKEDINYAKTLLNNKENLPANTQFRAFYLGRNTLPEDLKSLVSNNLDYPYYFYQNQHFILYGISEPYSDKQLYVFHKFAVHEDVPGIQLETITLLLTLLILCAMTLGAIVIYRRIANAMEYLNDVSIEPLKREVNEGGLHFIEVSNIAKALKYSVFKLEEKNSHERFFIQSLSHELRTSMAIIQVAVELLKKQTSGNKPLQAHRFNEKLNTIFHANLKMQSLANNLLSLWGGTSELEPSAVDLNTLITDCVKELSQGYELTHRVNMLLPVSHVIITASSFAVQLVLINLIKNAIVHGEGDIRIQLTQQKLIISNHIKHANADANDSVGMGLFIIEQGVDCLGWHYHVNSDVVHEVEITFAQ